MRTYSLEISPPTSIPRLRFQIVQPAGHADVRLLSEFRSIGRIDEPIEEVWRRSREGEEGVDLKRGETEGGEREGVGERLTEKGEEAGEGRKEGRGREEAVRVSLNGTTIGWDSQRSNERRNERDEDVSLKLWQASKRAHSSFKPQINSNQLT